MFDENIPNYALLLNSSSLIANSSGNKFDIFIVIYD